jgi:hypothetical protein
MDKDPIIAELEQTAHRFDLYLSDPARLQVHVRYGDARRHAANPPVMEMSDAEKTRAETHGWYISPENLNLRGPDEFAALDGTRVAKTAGGYINPYGPTGFAGSGVLGYGLDPDGKPTPESRAVDVVIQFIDPADGKLKFIGGIRSDTGQPCFVGGFQEQDALTTAVREFFEESISGSVDLKQYAPQLYQLCKVKKDGEQLSGEEKAYLKILHIDPEHFTGDQGEAAYPFIAREDPEFIAALTDYFKTRLTVAYQGPCRADPRNTDQRWIASTMLTGIIDRGEIGALLAGRKFAYRLAAGSDLVEVRHHEFGPAFVLTAFASHGPMACVAVAHNLGKMDGVPEPIIGQCRNVIRTMNDRMAWEAKIEPRHPLPVLPASAGALII